ncbi:MAG: hypothetical protein JSS91_09335 [Bacteroidetes bacterium]|nr:hypothetical protein [Bacteroidota bacterium]
MKSIYLIILLLSLFFLSCSKKETENKEVNNKTFIWKSELKDSDIPDTPIKGFLNGREIDFSYINFEEWRGSGDNVINFSSLKPKNNCGYIENDNAFNLMKKAGVIDTGEVMKANFDQNLDGFIASYKISDSLKSESKQAPGWNCVLLITSKDEKTVKGKIAMCFKDDKKSWIAGTFEAIRCYN